MTAAGAPHLFPLRVYYEDTDFSGVVYHASYLRFMERGRTEFIRSLGVDQAALYRETGFSFVVRRMEIDWLKPARMDDEVVVVTLPLALKGASMLLRQEVRRGDDTLVAAQVLVAGVAGGRAARLPPALRERLAAFAPAGN
jgi:acyl-CoA thioester hydrolase